MDQPLLFDRFPELAKTVPWVKLGTYPTPIQPMKKLGERIGHDSLWVKRDDLSSDLMGGNKVRIMEFLLAQMKAQGKTLAVSPGALGSNQIMSSAIFGHQLGLKIVGIFFKQTPTDYMCKHMLIDKSLGVEFHHVDNPYLVPFAILYYYLRHVNWRKLEAPFYVPTFGSSATCCLGYINAMLELKAQIDEGICPQPDYIFVTGGTGGTYAGIELGARMMGLRSKVVCVRITDYVALNEWMAANLINRAVNYLRQHGAPIGPYKYRARDVTMIHDYFGGEYAAITPEGVQTRALAAEAENLVLDTTYTAKTMAATLDYVKQHGLKGKHVLFWHTYNTRDLSPFLDEKVCFQDLPEDFHCYFKGK